MDQRGFLLSVKLWEDGIDWATYPFSIPAVRDFSRVRFHPQVTFFVGDNGSGKSTLVEAIAVAMRLNAEGGTKDLSFSTRSSESSLHGFVQPVRSTRQPDSGFFLRAESFYNVATRIEELGLQAFYGGSPHEQSHGESFLALALNRFQPNGLYILDEPEAALSIRGQLAFLRAIYDLAREGSQFIISSHSPILTAYPNAVIYELNENGIRQVRYEDTAAYELTKSFLENPDRFLRHLLADEPSEEVSDPSS